MNEEENQPVKYHITAYQDFTLRAAMPGLTLESARWVRVKAGETVITGTLIGVHPDDVPGGFPFPVQGVRVVIMPGGWQAGPWPMDCFGLFRAEAAGETPRSQ